MTGVGRFDTVVVIAATAALAAGLVLNAFDATELGNGIWAAAIAVALIVTGIDIVRDLMQRRGGVDILAFLALAGSLAMGEYLAGVVIALMLASGRALEAYAGRRAHRELASLLARAPQTAHRFDDGKLVEIPVEDVARGDRLLVRTGEVLPVDGLLRGETATLDESALTGEPMPVERAAGDRLPSGVVNTGPPFELNALETAARSTYAGVVRLVREAETARSPMTRLADRYALWFVPLALALAGFAWLISGDPVRALAVLVVATPCPLLLAVPIAVVSGLSSAARRGVLIKNGGALEALARADVVLFDKTGTLTSGRARLTGIQSLDGTEGEEILRLAASLDQVSQHVTAAAIVAEARQRGLALALPEAVKEQPGQGVEGRVDGCRILIGGADFVALGLSEADQRVHQIAHRAAREGASPVFVVRDGVLCGALVLADEIRVESARVLRALRRAGITRTVMVSGDRAEVAQSIGNVLGVDRVLADQSPEDKLTAVSVERGAGTLVMVGDGINDAPALAAADVGVAMGARGAGASSEAADVVLMVDRLDRLNDALFIARRTVRIARESVYVGMGLAIIGMGFAAAGLLTPVAGAVVQEVIDVLAIVSALRALRVGRRSERGPTLPADVVAALRAEHEVLRPAIERLDRIASGLDDMSDAQARAALREVEATLRDSVIPHEREEEQGVYPRIAASMSGSDPLAGMNRTHREIFHLAGQFSRLVADLEDERELDWETRAEARRLLYGLAAIERLHFAQEEELFDAIEDGEAVATG